MLIYCSQLSFIVMRVRSVSSRYFQSIPHRRAREKKSKANIEHFARSAGRWKARNSCERNDCIFQSPRGWSTSCYSAEGQCSLHAMKIKSNKIKRTSKICVGHQLVQFQRHVLAGIDLNPLDNYCNRAQYKLVHLVNRHPITVPH